MGSTALFQASLHTAAKSPTQGPTVSTSAAPLLHLASLANDQHTLCGLSLSGAVLGGYCEHLDGIPDGPHFVRMIFSHDGRAGESCAECLKRHPAILTSEDPA